MHYALCIILILTSCGDSNSDENDHVRIKAVAAGQNHTVAIKDDGTLWAWGRNNRVQLGDGTYTQRNTPVQVGTDADWASVSAGREHTVAIKTNETLWAWGYNLNGQLGNGTQAGNTTPFRVKGDGVTGFLESVKTVSAGGSHTVAIIGDGELWAWGENSYGQLGTNNTTSNNVANWSPVRVKGEGGTGFLENVKTVSAGQNHTVAIIGDGELWAWGDNWVGQLGDGTTTQRNTPVRVGAATDWDKVSAGGEHTVAIKTNGTLLAWGRNNHGQLGDGTIANKNTPFPVDVSAVPYPKTWKAVSAGQNHTVAIKDDGSIWTWGSNTNGQLGNASEIRHNRPVRVWAGIFVSAGDYHTVAIKYDGSLWAWGFNGYGQLGNGSLLDRRIPAQVIFSD